MERIRAAIEKARELREAEDTQKLLRMERSANLDQGLWHALSPFELKPRQLHRNRIVTESVKDPARASFNVLRTRVLSACRKNNWNVIGVTSPTSGCGKTVTSVNLAFSMARQRSMRAVLMDADLRKPMVGQLLGVDEDHSMERFLTGGERIEDHFVRYRNTLAIGTHKGPSPISAEVLQDPAAATAMEDLLQALVPDIVIVDLPPMKAGDDTLAFLPNVDAMLIVAAAEQSTTKEIDTCERELAEQTNILGVVLNKCRYSGQTAKDVYY